MAKPTPSSTLAAVRCVPALRCAFAACLLLALGACSLLAPRPVLPISDVIAVSKGGQGGSAIQRIDSSATVYALRGSDFGKLADDGVPNDVLDHLQQSFYNTIDLLTRYWVLGETLGGCNNCYPQPLDLASLASGGNGMGDASNLGRTIDYSKPTGLPDWVTAVPGNPNWPSIDAAQVTEMVKSGESAEAVVARIDSSRAHDYIDHQGFFAVSTHFKVGLSGSQLAQMRKDGVPDAVLDALQRKYIAEFIEFNRMRYQNLGKGSVQN